MACSPLSVGVDARSTLGIWRWYPRQVTDSTSNRLRSRLASNDLAIVYSISLERAGSGSACAKNFVTSADHLADPGATASSDASSRAVTSPLTAPSSAGAKAGGTDPAAASRTKLSL